MAQARLSVRKIREILRLRAEGFSERDIAGSVGVARSSIQICLWRAERAGVGWPPPADQDDAALEALLYPRPKPGVEVHPKPDFEWIERRAVVAELVRSLVPPEGFIEARITDQVQPQHRDKFKQDVLAELDHLDISRMGGLGITREELEAWLNLRSR